MHIIQLKIYIFIRPESIKLGNCYISEDHRHKYDS